MLCSIRCAFKIVLVLRSQRSLAMCWGYAAAESRGCRVGLPQPRRLWQRTSSCGDPRDSCNQERHLLLSIFSSAFYLSRLNSAFVVLRELGKVSWGETAVILDFVQMRGGGGEALPKFFGTCPSFTTINGKHRIVHTSERPPYNYDLIVKSWHIECFCTLVFCCLLFIFPFC